MKIALVSDWYAPRIGGLEVQMRDLARHLRATGHEVEVITATPGVERLDGIRVHRLDVPLLPGLRTIYRGRSGAALEAVLEAQRYDVVHAHTAFSPLAQLATKIARRRGLPSVLTEHSVLKGAGGAILGLEERLLPWSSWPDVLTAVSSYVAGEMTRVTGREVLILPNGVEPGEWQRPNEPVSPPRITTVMRLMKRKRPVDFVRAIPRVHAALAARGHGGPRPRFSLVGDGPERARVEREAERLGVRPFLDLHGWQERAKVQEILAGTWAFALPTSKEALSIATLEALSAGVPTVAMGHGGVGDIITHGQEGFLAPDFDAWVGHLVELVADPVLRARMAEAARPTALRFAWPQVIARHLELYRLAQTRAAGAAPARA